jgi:hypothetical protein
MQHYTYAHFRESDNRVFYIGKGVKRRAWACAKDNRGEHWHRVKKKHGCRVEILAKWATAEEAFEHEKFLIAMFRDMGHPLVNITAGGEGNLGVKFDSERLERHAKKAEDQWAKADAPIRVATTSPEFKAKMVGVNREIGMRPEQRVFRSEVAKRNWATKREQIKAAHAATVCKKVFCVETGDTHESLHMAAVWLRTKGWPKAMGNIVGVCANGHKAKAYGFTWKFLKEE